MAHLRFTRHLFRFFPDLEGVSQIEGDTVAQVVQALDDRFAGLGAYLVDDRGALRKHVNIFVDGEQVRDRLALSDAVGDDTEITIIQALSGG